MCPANLMSIVVNCRMKPFSFKTPTHLAISRIPVSAVPSIFVVFFIDILLLRSSGIIFILIMGVLFIYFHEREKKERKD